LCGPKRRHQHHPSDGADLPRCGWRLHASPIRAADRSVRPASARFTTTDLSTGQRKRLALLIAILEDRPVYVFDEWAADQDPAFRRLFYKTLLPDLKLAGKAIIAATHDDRYFDLCDRLIIMEGGRMVTPAAPILFAERSPIAERIPVRERTLVN